MQVLIGLVVLGFLANAMGFWFWIIVALGVAGCVAHCIHEEWQEEKLTDEEREERRRHREEERHAARMQALELQGREQAAKKDRKNAVVGTALKLGLGLLTSTVAGRHHGHRH